MASPLQCASCGPPIPARVLVLHDHLEKIAIPMCKIMDTGNTTGAVEAIPIDSPKGAKVLATYRIATGYVVPR